MKRKQTDAPFKLPLHLTAQQLCFLLGVTPGRLSHLCGKGGPLVRLGRDRYAIDSVPNFVRLQRERGDRSHGFDKARTALMRERAAAYKAGQQQRERQLDRYR